MYKKAIEETALEEKIAEIKEKENYTTIENLPQIYIDAVIAVEDHRFREHKGIDYISIGRAIVTNIKTMKFAEGGSTITQQLAKNIYFSQKKKITRKVAEIFMVFDIEEKCSKDEILELYVNTSYFGDGCYNIKDACNHYFDKEPIEMTSYEATMLAGIPNAPSVYAPTQNLELSIERQKQVLSKMVKYGYLTEEESAEILNEGEEYIWNIGT